MIEKNSVRASAVFDSVFRISSFLLMLIESLMYDLYESDCFIILQNVLLSVIYFTFKFLQQVFVKEIGSNFFAYYIMNSVTFRPISQKVITKFIYCLSSCFSTCSISLEPMTLHNLPVTPLALSFPSFFLFYVCGVIVIR